MKLFKMLTGTITFALIVCGVFELAGVIVMGASAIAYSNDPQAFYVITGAGGLLVAVLADVA
jgi:hypothetical protein